MKPKLMRYATTGLGLLLVICAQPAFGVTDYMFFSVNGDSTATSMIQGDLIAWGANCDVGGSLYWEVWYDIDEDDVIDDLEDYQVATMIATDGDTIGEDGPPDISPTPDGWYITPPMILGLAAGHYLFEAVNLTDSTSVQKLLTCTEMTSPPNTFSGHLVILGHPEPIPDLLKNLWVQAFSGEAENQVWSAMTNDSGRFQINIGSIGTGLTFRVSPPAIPGFTSPAEQTLVAAGHIVGVDFVYVGPPFGKTDYMFFSVNGDSTATSMVQGDSVAWGANCAGGGSLRWEIWYDLDEGEIINIPGDVILFSFTGTDGNTRGEDGPPDINPVPDGWYITPPMVLGVAPGHYVFKAVNFDDPSEVQKPLVCSEMISPPNTLSGHLIVPGHPAPDSAILMYRWVQAESESAADQIWTAMTNDSGRFQINISSVGTGLTFQVSPPDIPGFVAPGSQMLLASGHTENVNFEYVAPADSVWGFVLDQDSVVIMQPVRFWCNPMYGSGGKDAWTENGRYVFLFGPSEYGAWSVGWPEGLIPDYMRPGSFDFDNSIEHGIRHDFVCPIADTVMYARVTEANGPPSHQYKIEVRQEPSGVETMAVSGTGASNVVTLHISKLYSSGYGAGISVWDDDYPIPPGYTPDYNPGAIYGPGDTVHLNLLRDFLVSDTIRSDPADPPLDWDSASIYISGDQYYAGDIDTNGVFTVYVQSGWYTLSLYIPGHFTDPGTYNLGWVNHDTIGGLGFEVNRAHCRVHGTLVNVPLPLSEPVWLYAHGDEAHPGYQLFPDVDGATGTYEMMLCDGDWTIEAPDVIPNRQPPAPVNLTIENTPDSVRVVDLEYSEVVSADEVSGVALPTVFAVEQNYPNPFNPVTIVEYSVPTRARVTIDIFNVLGQKVRTLVDEMKSAGSYRAEWNGADDAGQPVSTGIYLYRFRAGDVVQAKKMLLLK